MLIQKKYDYTKFMNAKPTKIGKVLNVTFYEHPTLGDESPMIAVFTANGKTTCGLTYYYDLPTSEELRHILWH